MPCFGMSCLLLEEALGGTLRFRPGRMANCFASSDSENRFNKPSRAPRVPASTSNNIEQLTTMPKMLKAVEDLLAHKFCNAIPIRSRKFIS